MGAHFGLGDVAFLSQPIFINDLPTAARAIAGDSRYPSKGASWFPIVPGRGQAFLATCR